MVVMSDGFAPGMVRVTDMDRKAVEARLRQAHVDGSLTLDELDERLVGLWQTTTRADLAVLTRDLPLPSPPPPPPPAPKAKGRALRVLTAIWLSLVMVNATIWLIVCLGSWTVVYPWFIWVLFPPGAVYASLWLVARSRR
jgi:transposase